MLSLEFIYQALIWYVVFIISLTVHEYAHAFMANELGDDTAKLMGRMSLNPLVHIDPVGTVIMPILGILFSGTALSYFIIGWAKPVIYNPLKLKHRKDELKIALMGPAANLILATLVSLGFLAAKSVLVGVNLAQTVPIITHLIYINIFLAVFNLIPVPPLDGSKIWPLFLGNKSLKVINGLGYFNLLIAILLAYTLVPFAANIIFAIITLGGVTLK